MTETINLQPARANLKLYAGDGVSLGLGLIFTDGTKVDLSQGVIAAQIRDKREDPKQLADFAVNMAEAAQGVVGLSLTGAQTAGLMTNGYGSGNHYHHFHGSWDVQYLITGGEPVTLVQGNVECVKDVTR